MTDRIHRPHLGSPLRSLTLSLGLVLVAGMSSLAGSERVDIDVVVLTNGHQITGTVVRAPEDARNGSVTIRQTTGEAILPAALVHRIHLGYASRRARLDVSDYHAVLELAQWAKDRGLLAEAEELARIANGLAERDGTVVLLLAQLLDAKVGGQVEALAMYRTWRNTYGGNDPSALARLDELERHIQAHEQAMAQWQNSATVAQETHVEGLEAQPGWSGDRPEHFNPVTVNIITDESLGIQNKVLSVTYQPGDHDKAALRRRATFDARTLSNGQITFKVANPGRRPLGLSLAVKSGAQYIYAESTIIRIPSGDQYQELTFNLLTNDWKNAASNWSHSGSIETPENIREIQILIHNGRSEGTIFIDSFPTFQ